ncbi:oocyte zinc finger protein XlCOF6.1-like isoform X2 [Periplaneta americana]
MDVIKIEPDINPLLIQSSDKEEKKPLSKEGNLLDLHVTRIKEECVDESYDHNPGIKFEEIILPNSFLVVKCEDEEDVFDLDRVEEEQKLEVSSEKDEVLTERIVDIIEKRVPQALAGMDREEDKLTQCGSNRSNCSNISDFSCNSFKSNICNETFLTPQSLKLYSHRHATKRSYKCDVCGKCFSKLSDIKRHVLIHTGEMPFHCKVCGKSFKRLFDLNRHIRIHTGERPFKCEVCGKCFSESSVIKRHTRIHTGEKPFKCEVCGRCFSQSGALNTHARIHTGKRPFICEKCGKCFSASAFLYRHASIHAPE